MFADIFADKSDNFFLDPWRYIRRHDICNTDMDATPWNWLLGKSPHRVFFPFPINLVV